MRIDGIPDDLNDSTLVKEAPDLATIVKTALNAQALIGNSIRIPGENASDADKAEFRAKLEKVGMVPKDKAGEFLRPEKPEHYALKDPPKEAETVITQPEIDALKAWAHEQGLSPPQFQALALSQIEQRIKAARSQQEAYAAVDDVVKQKYGEAGVTAAKERALAAAVKFGGQAFAEQLAKAPDGQTIIALAEVGKLFQERGMGDLSPQPRFVESREEAETKLNEIRMNPAHPFNNRMMNRKAYEIAAAEVMRLQSLALGERPQKDYLFEESA